MQSEKWDLGLRISPWEQGGDGVDDLEVRLEAGIP